MNSFKFLFKKVVGPRGGVSWIKQGGGLTSGNFAIRTPGVYRTNRLVNGWWQTPSAEVEITEAEIKRALQSHDYGVYV